MDTEQLQKRIEVLEREIQSLKSNTTIPFDVDQAFRTRLKIETYSSLTASAKNPATTTQAVNEGGVQTYSVATPMDGFREMTVGGTTFYIPYYL